MFYWIVCVIFLCINLPAKINAMDGMSMLLNGMSSIPQQTYFNPAAASPQDVNYVMGALNRLLSMVLLLLLLLFDYRVTD